VGERGGKQIKIKKWLKSKIKRGGRDLKKTEGGGRTSKTTCKSKRRFLTEPPTSRGSEWAEELKISKKTLTKGRPELQEKKGGQNSAKAKNGRCIGILGGGGGSFNSSGESRFGGKKEGSAQEILGENTTICLSATKTGER